MLNHLHPSDQELLLAADGELRNHRAAQIRQHLADCWDCRARMAELEGTIGDFVRAHHQHFDSQLPSAAGPRARLRARLAEAARADRPQVWFHRLLEPNARRVAYACAVVVILALGASTVYWQTRNHSFGARVGMGLLPNPRLTPGATRPVAIADLCSANHDEVIRSVSDTVQQRVFQEYGIRERQLEKYEVDYLITPGLGGADDIKNLWPEPRYNTRWNSFVKDQLEDYLHQSVCGGKLSLETAQKDVASDWISAYKKYFHTGEPLSRSSALDPSHSPGS
jgi:hypothetical protein